MVAERAFKNQVEQNLISYVLKERPDDRATALYQLTSAKRGQNSPFGLTSPQKMMGSLRLGHKYSVDMSPGHILNKTG